MSMSISSTWIISALRRDTTSVTCITMTGWAAGRCCMPEELGKGPYYRIEDYEEYYEVGMEEDVDWEEMNNSYDFRPHTILDDSPESYFQYHVLSILGESV